MQAWRLCRHRRNALPDRSIRGVAFAGFRTLLAIRGVRLISWPVVAVARIRLEEGEAIEKVGRSARAAVARNMAGRSSFIIHHTTSSAYTATAFFILIIKSVPTAYNLSGLIKFLLRCTYLRDF
jgi:hypothetical protein